MTAIPTNRSTRSWRAIATPLVLIASMLATGCVAAAPHETPVNHPFGSLERASAVGSTVSFSGWADDKDSSGPIEVRVSIGRRGAVLHADEARADVHARHRRGPRKGFAGSFTNVGDGAHQLCAVAINRGSGADKALGCRTVLVETSRGGYTSLDDWRAAPSMGIHLHTSASALGSLMPSAVAELAKATGNPYTYEGLTSSLTPISGQLIVHASNSSGCGGVGWVGCAEIHARHVVDPEAVIDSSLVTIKPAYLTHPEVRGILMHELGHSAGLGHFDQPYLGAMQIMMWRMNGQTRYQRGDLNGLAYSATRGRDLTAKVPPQNAMMPPGPTVVIAD